MASVANRHDPKKGAIWKLPISGDGSAARWGSIGNWRLAKALNG